MVFTSAGLQTALNIGAQSMGLFGSLFGGNSAKQSLSYSKALQNHQYQLERQSRQTAYGDTRKSLEDAGYNPMLAVGQQSGSLPVGNQLTVQDEKSERLQNSIALGSAIANMRNLWSQTSLNKSQEGVNSTVKDLNTQATYKTFADELASRSLARMYDMNSAQAEANIYSIYKKLPYEIEQIRAGTKFTNERARGFSASSSSSISHGGRGASFGYNYGNNKSSSQTW